MISPRRNRSAWLILVALAALAVWVVAAALSAVDALRSLNAPLLRLRPIMVTAATREPSISERMAKVVEACAGDHDLFARAILGRDGPRAYWSRQREICRSVQEVHTTVVPAGNAVGKSYVAAGILLSFLYQHPNCLVFSSAPTQTQLLEVLWKEVRRTHGSSRLPLGGRIGGNPVKLDLGDGWQAIGHVSNKVEAMSGHHAPDLLAIIDEASGAPEAVYEAANSLNPSRVLLIGNPLRPSGRFFELCNRADEGAKGIRKIRVPSTESPDIDLERSPRGMADKGFLESNREAYGENSIWWQSHVLALFPGQADDALIHREWLDLAGRTIHKPAGPMRMSIDLAIGNGQGDLSVILIRDDNGVHWLEWSRSWSFEATASKAALLAQRFGIKPHLITYDAGAIGHDFGNRLASVGLANTTPYLGGRGGTRFSNLRTASAWAMRLRLDPNHWRTTPAGIRAPQAPFSIRADWLAQMRAELEGLRYMQDSTGRIQLEPKEDYAARLRHSPDFADVFAQSFAYPNAV